MRAKNLSKAQITVLLVTGLLAVIGIVCWVIQLNRGLILTNLSVRNMWGLYISGFMIFTGISAGCLFFASASQILDSLKEFRPYAAIASLIAMVSGLVAASLFIIVDIGNPERVWQFLASPNLVSPMIWDAIILGLYVILSFILTWKLLRQKGSSPRLTACLGMVAGLMVFVTSFVFSLQAAQPTWNTPAQPVSFILSAFTLSLAVLILVMVILDRAGQIQISQALVDKMGRGAALMLLAEGLLVGFEVVTGLYTGGSEHHAVSAWLVSGAGTTSFWLEIGLIVLAVILLASKAGSKTRSVLGATAALLAVYLIKSNLLQAQLANPLLKYPGPGGLAVNLPSFYLPSPLELGVALGIIALGCFCATLGLSLFNFETGQKD